MRAVCCNWIAGISPSWLLFYSDTTVYNKLPLEGVLGFNEVKSILREPENWAIYEVEGNKGPCVVNGVTYRELPNVDGLLLHGSWTYYEQASDGSSHPDGDKPIITFSRDGRFVDSGLFKSQHLPIPETM
ncbi:MAG TPA: hypothetical protein DDZ66_01750 [Firmicutes bacterium]|nr:hypothetical protein [Bacillota bacterium]